MNFLAERVSRNVRRMEGALTRIASYDALINQTARPRRGRAAVE